MRHVAVVVLVGLAAVAWWFVGSSSRPEPLRRPNVVLVTVDTLRADRLGRGFTPAIDGLAARGVSYLNTRATVPLTLPSHVSIMTGTLPPAHGVRENGVVFDRRVPTLARTFKADGYATAAFVAAYVLNRRFGLDDGFEIYDDAVPRDPARAERLEAERDGGAVVDAAVAWLSASRPAATPFFLWIHLYDPHAPYEPPPGYRERAGGDAYDGEVAYADAQIGRLLAALEAGGLTGTTVVAVVGDHGEALGEHGEETHGMLAYDATLRVPMVVAAPASTGTRDSTARSVADLNHLLLESAGLGAVRPAVPVYAESQYPRRAGWHALEVLADDRWKLIRSSEVELYATDRDPGERQNVAADHPTVVQAMSAALDRVTAGARPVAVVAPEAKERLRALGYVSGAGAVAVDQAGAPNPARTIAAWTSFERALGLLQAGSPAAAADALKRLVDEHPDAPVFASTHAQALRESGEGRAALRAYQTAVRRWPADPALYHDLAVAAREAGDAAEAVRAEQAALALDGASPLAQNGLGLLHADAGRHDEAADAFARAAKLDPSNPSYWSNLGNARGASGDLAGAEQAYGRALYADAGYADALNGLGALAVRARQFPRAIPLFERALEREPGLYEARLNLGIALQENGDRDGAAAAYRRVLATAPPTARREREAATTLLKGLGG